MLFLYVFASLCCIIARNSFRGLETGKMGNTEAN